MKPLVGFDWPEGRSKQVVFVSQDHHIHEFVVGVEGNWQHTDLTTLAGASLASSRFITGYAWPESSTKQVAYLSQDGHIHELWVQPGEKWQYTDVSVITGAPPARLVTAGYSWSEGHSKQIVFIGDDGHMHELYMEMGEQWRHVDLTVITAAPLPGSRFMVGYGWKEGRSKQVAYVGQDGHIHEMYVEIGKSWEHADLTVMTNCPRAVDVMVGYEWLEGRCKQIAFTGEDRHIHELSLVAGQRWAHADLNMLSGAPPATDVITGFAWPEGHSKQVEYVGLDNHIHEMFVEVGKTWQHVDLTQLANAPVTQITSIDGYAWSAGEAKQVAYVGDDRQIRELWLPKDGKWTYTDLSAVVLAMPVGF
jgi:hypothetical protein